jgi:glycosyltransferase involved in cell wall biosynthesis
VNEPSFAVVVAAYNAERTLAATVESVLGQTRAEFELAIVDDGSTDGTLELAESFDDPRVKVFRQENGGTAAARNAGIAGTRAPLVAILDSDDLWLPRYLETMGRLLDGNPGAALAYTDAWVLDDSSGRISRRHAASSVNPPQRPPDDPRELLELLLRGNFVFASATLRRTVVEEVGLFDRRCNECEDYELWLRFAAHGCRFVRSEGPLAIYRNRAGSKSSNELRLLGGVRDCLDVVLSEYELDDDLRAAATRRRAAVNAELTGRLPRIRRRLRGHTRRVMAPYLWRRTPPPEVAGVLRGL